LLSGSITTDGTIGTLTVTNIIAWTFTVTATDGETFTQTDPGPGAAGASLFGVVATANQIQLFDPGPSGYNYFQLGGSAGQITVPGFLMYSEGGAGVGLTNVYTAELTLSNGEIYGAWYVRPSDSDLGGPPWIIAETASAVPEPDAITIAMFGIACFAVVEWTMRRRR